MSQLRQGDEIFHAVQFPTASVRRELAAGVKLITIGGYVMEMF
jgi:hypothetical protein